MYRQPYTFKSSNLLLMLFPSHFVYVNSFYYLKKCNSCFSSLCLRKCVYVKSLERNDAVTVFKHWGPYNTATTVEDIADEIIRLPSAGVFLRSNNQLIAWMHLHPPNGMSRLFTLEEHRRKGYADLITRYLCKRVAQTGHSPYVLIAEGNNASERFFQHHMGFSWQGSFYIQETFDY